MNAVTTENRTLSDRCLFALTLVFLFWLPLPWGSNRAWASGMLVTGAALLLSMRLLLIALGTAPASQALWRQLRLPLLWWLTWLTWIGAQLVPLDATVLARWSPPAAELYEQTAHLLAASSDRTTENVADQAAQYGDERQETENAAALQESLQDDRAGDEGKSAADVRPPESKRGVIERNPQTGRGSDERVLRDGDDGTQGKSPGTSEKVTDGSDRRTDDAEKGSGGDRPVSGTGVPDRKREGLNYRAEPGTLKREGSWRATAARNLDIVELIKKIESEGRQATPEEQAQLVKFTGWGASEIAQNLFPQYDAWAKPEWKDLVKRRNALMTEAEKAAAARTTQYAHYTSEEVIRGIWKAIQEMGFNGGNILEPGMGIGLFPAAAPESIMAKSRYTGIEYDPFTAKIAKQLFQRENIIEGDFTKVKLPKDFFDVVIGNPPFGKIPVVNDPEYAKYRFPIHDYFFAKSIDSVRPGGLVVFITSRFTMDKENSRARKYLADRADLLGAIRLPQTAFKENAGTEVVTDILFLRKRMSGDNAPISASISIARSLTIDAWLLSAGYACLYILILISCHGDRGRMRAVLATLVIAGLLQATYGSVMVLSGLEWGFFAEKEFYRGVATGTFVNRNHLAGYLELCAAAALGLVLSDLGSNHRSRSLRQHLLDAIALLFSTKMRARLALAVMAIGLILTRSRMGNIAFFVSLTTCGMIFVLLRHRSQALRALALFASVIAIDILIVSKWYGLERVVERIEQTRYEVEGRATFLQEVPPVIDAYGLVGSGLGTFALAYAPYRSANMKEHFDHAHNDYVEFLIETGVIGLALLATFVLAHALHAVRILVHRQRRSAAAVGFAALMAMLAYAIHSIADFNLQIPANAATLLTLMALSAACSSRSRRATNRQPDPGTAAPEMV